MVKLPQFRFAFDCALRKSRRKVQRHLFKHEENYARHFSPRESLNRLFHLMNITCRRRVCLGMICILETRRQVFKELGWGRKAQKLIWKWKLQRINFTQFIEREVCTWRRNHKIKGTHCVTFPSARKTQLSLQRSQVSLSSVSSVSSVQSIY